MPCLSPDICGCTPHRQARKMKAHLANYGGLGKVGCRCGLQDCPQCMPRKRKSVDLFNYGTLTQMEKRMGLGKIYKWQVNNDPLAAVLGPCPSHKGDYGTNCDHCERDRLKAREEIAKTKRS